ncbi:MAG TPA: hypothetical protein VHT53_08085 [Candidatus Elarobacter sp.]|nr:hypothetical protein [Candidatus Elarobacter sp.]
MSFSPTRALLAVAAFAAVTGVAVAAGDVRGDLVQRVAAAGGPPGLRLAYGALPPGFTLPNPVPDLPLLGSSWLAGSNPPDAVRIYYRPSAATVARTAELVASLRKRGYVRGTISGFPDLFVGDGGPTQRWCPADYGPVFFLTLVGSGVQRALDVDVLRASETACASTGHASASAPGAPLPVLADIAGIAIESPARSARPRRIESTAVLRSALLESDVLARLSARFESAGWRGDPAVFTGESLERRFVRAGGATSWVLDLRLEQRAPGVYDATVVAAPP